MKKLCNVSILLIILLFISTFMHGAIPAHERAALIAFYNALNGDDWTDNSGWLGPPGTEGGWHGVTVRDNTVVSIRMYQNLSRGNLPPEFGNLVNLKSLVLYYCMIGGSLPAEFGNLVNLQYLKLIHCSFSGNIPASIGNFRGLRRLYLNGNDFSGSIPASLGNLTELTEFNLESNDLSGSIPPELGKLNKVRKFSLMGNNLSGSIPSELGNIHDLTLLDLSNNKLSGNIPPSLGNPGYLGNIYLNSNQLTGNIPPELGKLSRLKYLWLHKNQLSGSIPVQLGNLGSLKSLYLHTNQLSGNIPKELGNLDNLLVLSLSENQLNGSIPPELGNLGNLLKLYLGDSQLSGSIPPELGKLSNLSVLCLFTNQLTGSIPPELGNLSKLNRLYLYENQLSGSIPPEIGNLGRLDILSLHSNQLSGALPSEIGYIPGLRELILRCNFLSGEIPSSFANLTDVYELSIEYNCLQVTDPAVLYWLQPYWDNWSMRQNECAGITPALTLTVPNGGESWPEGTGQWIYWTSTGIVGNVKIEYSINGGAGWTTITGSTYNDRQYYWQVPRTVSSRCRVRISRATGGGPSDSSDGNFSIPQSQYPSFSLNRNNLSFTATTAANVTNPQEVWISTSGDGQLSWFAEEYCSWLTCTPSYGTGDGVISVSVDGTGLTQGTYSDSIAVTAPNADSSPQTIVVTLNVIAGNRDEKPFGEFATPMDGSAVSGSIPVTGWVLDDVGVESVKIYREEGNNGMVYIGDGVFVEGARDDIMTSFPDYPNNYKAGWGYMLLTNALPNNGNGTFTLHAIATDTGGNTKTLGTKTITVDNANAVVPFGALDTPTQGGEASGSKFANWGWVLAAQGKSIPTDGSTIKVWVDSVQVGQPSYNIYREDIAGLFPGYANSNGAGGSFSLDATGYENGVYSIYWTVEDSAGNAAGIGSRFFTIRNNGNGSRTTAGTRGNGGLVTGMIPGDLAQIPVNRWKPVHIQRGHKKVEPVPVMPDETGAINIGIRELERLEIHFFDAGGTIRAVSPLPTGSTLDTGAGIFYWRPAAGFIGRYPLVFLEKDSTGTLTRKEIMITIHPKFSVTK